MSDQPLEVLYSSSENSLAPYEIPPSAQPQPQHSPRASSEVYDENERVMPHSDREDEDVVENSVQHDLHAPQNRPATSHAQPSSSTSAYADTSPPRRSPTEDPESFLSAPFETFDAGKMLDDFEEDSKGGTTFESELTQRILELMLEFQVWAKSRPSHEQEMQQAKLVASLEDMQEKEEKQEKTRESLVNFLASVRQALAALENI